LGLSLTRHRGRHNGPGRLDSLAELADHRLLLGEAEGVVVQRWDLTPRVAVFQLQEEQLPEQDGLLGPGDGNAVIFQPGRSAVLPVLLESAAGAVNRLDGGGGKLLQVLDRRPGHDGGLPQSAPASFQMARMRASFRSTERRLQSSRWAISSLVYPS